MKPKSIEGDLLGLSVVEAVVNHDDPLLEDLLGQLRTRDDLLGALRCVSSAFASALTVNLNHQGALMQLALFRSAMIQDFYGSHDDT